MTTRSLKQAVLEANLDLPRHGLVTFTWGNASGFDPDAGIVAIKPSGVPYERLGIDDIVVLSLHGERIEGTLKPSSDTATHLLLYRTWPQLRGIVHTHSTHGAAWAQAKRPIPALGTTHADYFHGPIPCSRPLRPEEVDSDYELNTGRVIVETFRGLDPMACPGVLVAEHAPFAWGADPAEAVHNAVVLEEVARMALLTLAIDAACPPIADFLLDKHFLRKHGKNAYYGQR
ncbi:MAG TPA: L-ribulose-5-phosphate 4-epimerase [Burkholderiaceae bacterium]|nr:L-ribulose-5-phosphate 4-epimerase [Burkholderiaceae bacterium]